MDPFAAALFETSRVETSTASSFWSDVAAFSTRSHQRPRLSTAQSFPLHQRLMFLLALLVVQGAGQRGHVRAWWVGWAEFGLMPSRPLQQTATMPAAKGRVDVIQTRSGQAPASPFLGCDRTYVVVAPNTPERPTLPADAVHNREFSTGKPEFRVFLCITRQHYVVCARNSIGLPGNRQKPVFWVWHPKYSVLRAEDAEMPTLPPTNRPLLFKPVARNKKADACRSGRSESIYPDPTNNHHHQPSGTAWVTTSYILHSVRSLLNFPHPTCADTTGSCQPLARLSKVPRVTLCEVGWQSKATLVPRYPTHPSTAVGFSALYEPKPWRGAQPCLKQVQMPSDSVLSEHPPEPGRNIGTGDEGDPTLRHLVGTSITALPRHNPAYSGALEPTNSSKCSRLGEALPA